MFVRTRTFPVENKGMGGEMVPGVTVTLGESGETIGVAGEMLFFEEYKTNEINKAKQKPMKQTKPNRNKNKQNPNKQ